MVLQGIKMFISRKSIFAISVMMDIAHNAKDRLVSAKELADRHGVMPRFFEIMLKNLANYGLIRGQRGPKGGYQLARTFKDISIADIVQAVSFERDEEDKELVLRTAPSLLPFLQATNSDILERLKKNTLADLMRDESQQSVRAALAS